ncbi:acetyltransferase (GNAT) family protein [Halopolyspora algeriensis]|uniref:Acetyltransferase (GNAT) family protein n=1 Tax=Halopolyspora algeriensis TaxID=1500506 RepID=A0A368VI16_9ACTN|nr:GNAT family N-acetyltransferase [Halopolyspora algeriensis]RCW40824.1 acetyltransferase (GNAT) family protein [Halopolyspora algeriensis]TQM53259.1 acetyltransferase (GNAT) family protein [Halopolyspora algeriensis]
MDVDIAPFDLDARLWDTATLAQDAMAAAHQPGWALAGQYLGEVTELPGLLTLAAHRQGRLTGVLIGFPTASRDWWPNQVRPALAAAENLHWLEDAFELAELHVHPEAQGRGLGSALLNEAVRHIEQHRIVLSTGAIGNRPTRGFYRKHGFRTLTAPFRWMETPLRVFVLGRELTDR